MSSLWSVNATSEKLCDRHLEHIYICVHTHEIQGKDQLLGFEYMYTDKGSKVGEAFFQLASLIGVDDTCSRKKRRVINHCFQPGPPVPC